MKIPLYVLHSLALVAQISGGVLVVSETVATLRNVRSLRNDLTKAEAVKQQHRDALKMPPPSMPRFGGGAVSLPTLPLAAREGMVQQLGPGAAAERKALREFLEGQFPGDRKRAWLGVWLLFGGILVGYIANILGVAT